MRKLIIQQNMTKNATEEDGPSFEQQFGILANAVVADKFPQLDSMKLAFQLIEKEDDNSKACGAGIYIIGRSVVFIPAFFMGGNIKTADMMLLADTQQFLPLSDPWIQWIKSKDIVPEATMVDDTVNTDGGSVRATTIRELNDPIIKSASVLPKLHKSANVPGLYFWERACGIEKSAKMAEDVMKDSYSSMSSVYMKGLCKLDPQLTKKASDMSVLDTALHLGRETTASMLDSLMKEDMLNATLSFYNPSELQKFASVAQTMDPAPAFKVIMPFDKEAKELKANEQKALYKDGFFIKCAKEDGDAPQVIKKQKISNLFGILNAPGKTSILQPDGSFKEVFVARSAGRGWNGDRKVNSYTADRNGQYFPEPFAKENASFLIIDGDNAIVVDNNVMELLSQREDFSEKQLESVGSAMSSAGSIERKKDKDGYPDGPEDVYLIYPDGSSEVFWGDLIKGDDKTWSTGFDTTIQLADEKSGLRRPMRTGNIIVIPYTTRYVRRAGKGSMQFVTMACLDHFIQNYTAKNYKKVRIYHNGSDYTVSGDKSENGDELLSMKQAALALVTDYGISPADAKVMLKDASNGATYDRPRSTHYLITKTAADGQWEDSNIPYEMRVNMPPQISQHEMPTIVEDPAQLEQAVTMAAQNGIKEVFDVTVLKLLVKQNRFFDEIHDDLPTFMKVLDSLCRKLFQFYWHTEKMEEKYGMVKLKALEESLKVTLDSLSELTIFFKLRTVDGTGSTGDTTGELMVGDSF